MFGSNMTRQTLTVREAQRLATAVEIISQDMRAPVEITPRVNGTDVTRFQVTLALPDTHARSGADVASAAHSIAQELQAWSNLLKYTADAIRERYPLPEGSQP